MPFTDSTFFAHLSALLPKEVKHLAVAVSGGADSMALCLIAQKWAAEHDCTLVALTVDHGLRPNSRSEAKQVHSWLSAQNIEHHILAINVPNTHNIQACARDARYKAMAAFCKQRDIIHLLTAHHRDDQAETLLMRLGRGSGVDGLSAIAPITQHYGLTLIRPLLDTPKKALIDYLTEANQPWVEDPSNAGDNYARNRLRHALVQEYGEEIISQRLADTAKHMARARTALAHYTDHALQECATLSPFGYAELDIRLWCNYPEEIRLRMLQHLLCIVDGEEEIPRFDPLFSLSNELFTATEDNTHSLHHCLIHYKAATESVIIQREPEHVQGGISFDLTHGALWDKRFLIHAHHIPDSLNRFQLEIRALGKEQATVFKRMKENNIAQTLPHSILSLLPGIWQLEELVAVPHIEWKRADYAACDFSVEFIPAKSLAA